MKQILALNSSLTKASQRQLLDPISLGELRKGDLSFLKSSANKRNRTLLFFFKRAKNGSISYL